MALDFVDPWHHGWWRHLEGLYQALGEGECLHLLIDSVFLPGLHRTFLRADEAVACLFDGNPGEPEALREVSPLLWTFHPDAQAVRQALDEGRGAPMLSALVTREPLGDLAARLHPWCVVEVEGQWFNCRFPDTRRLPGIHGALTPAQQASMTGPASAWHVLGRDGRWGMLALKPQDAPAATEVRLSDVQFAQILDDAAADEILFKFMLQGQHRGRQHAVLHTQVVQALTAARAHDLDEAMHASWCGHWVTLAPVAETEGGVSAGAAGVQAALRAWMQENTA